MSSADPNNNNNLLSAFPTFDDFPETPPNESPPSSPLRSPRNDESLASGSREFSREVSRSSSPRSPPSSPETDEEPGSIIEAVTSAKHLELGDQVVMLKLPKSVSLAHQQFDSETYAEDDDPHGQAHLYPTQKDTNVVRWRTVVDRDGTERRESNASVVKWSDGTMSLRIGDEYYDFGLAEARDCHVFSRQGPAMVAQGLLPERVVFRPHSNSNIQNAITRAATPRVPRSAGIRVITNNEMNPEVGREAVVREEQRKLRQAIKAQHITHARGGRDREYRAYHYEIDDYDQDSDEGLTRRSWASTAGTVPSDSEQGPGRFLESSDSDEESRRIREKPKKLVVQDSDDDDE
ncbi:unnamed protein product, partial [Mesorhabditis spiculigera]